MTNNERFNEMLNACENPQQMYDALLALAETGFFDRYRQLKEQRKDEES